MATHQTHAHEEKDHRAHGKTGEHATKAEPKRETAAAHKTTQTGGRKTDTKVEHKGGAKTHHEWKTGKLSAEDRRYLEQHGEELSRSTQRAKWIGSPNEHEDRPGQTLATRSHDVIRSWAEERKAVPATVASGDANDPRVLRFNFPGYGGQNLQQIAWEAWFKPFDARELVFVFQEHQKAGNQSNFFHLDSPDRDDG